MYVRQRECSARGGGARGQRGPPAARDIATRCAAALSSRRPLLAAVAAVVPNVYVRSMTPMEQRQKGVMMRMLMRGLAGRRTAREGSALRRWVTAWRPGSRPPGFPPTRPVPLDPVHERHIDFLTAEHARVLCNSAPFPPLRVTVTLTATWKNLSGL